MDKKRILLLINGLFLTSLISAFNGYGSYFSLSDFLRGLDSSNIILTGIFLISFAILNMALLKVFKDNAGQPNKTVAGVVAFVVSVFIVYGINTTGIDFSNIFFSLGFSSDLIYPILVTLFIAGLGFAWWEFGIGKTLMALGGVMILGSFLIYDAESFLTYGLILFLIGVFLTWRRKKKRESVDWGNLASGAEKFGKGVGAAGAGAWEGAKAGAQWAKDKFQKQQAEQQKEYQEHQEEYQEKYKEQQKQQQKAYEEQQREYQEKYKEEQKKQQRAYEEQQEQYEKQQKKVLQLEHYLMKEWKKDRQDFYDAIKNKNPEVKKIYKKLIFKYHPDKNNGDPYSVKITQELNEMYKWVK